MYRKLTTVSIRSDSVNTQATTPIPCCAKSLPTTAQLPPGFDTPSKELPRAEPVGYAAWGSMGTSS
jgi:hypothetical protein